MRKIVHEISLLNNKFGIDIPLILMIPYNNYDQFRNGVQPKYKHSKLHIISIYARCVIYFAKITDSNISSFVTSICLGVAVCAGLGYWF